MSISSAPNAQRVPVRVLSAVVCLTAIAACLAIETPAQADFASHDSSCHHPPIPLPDPVITGMTSFDASKLETPESIAIDSHGNKFLSFALTGEIRKINSNGNQSTFAMLPIGAPPLTTCGPFIGIMGALAIDPNDNLYVTVASCVAANRGIWKVAHNSGAMSLVASLGPSALPDGIAYRDGLLYVADAEQGLIWRTRADGTEAAQIWADDPLLKPGLNHIYPGPNGVQFFNDELYVANSNQFEILAIPLRRHGAAGTVRVHATGIACDDFAFDVLGNMYCTTDPFNTLVRIAPDGTSEVLLTAADGLDGPTASVFGRGKNDRLDLYVTNGSFPFFSTTHQPSLMVVDVGIAGAPR